ncbi:hypothetical protein HYDPIDRAFT_34890 [Hydnomerulius pinastri MD-312]|uniref:Uncharacterized protein n=1 Tax=Hydnomerulius pinastri MD-312 TaxID=994086 RepID=A0A0C9W6F3_9AGAM|nr:hypothetical protein HYDPIDRAFT_34890 [Hydnomerulius pinastri MD-312]
MGKPFAAAPPASLRRAAAASYLSFINFVMGDAGDMDPAEVERDLEDDQSVTTPKSPSKPKSSPKGRGKSDDIRPAKVKTKAHPKKPKSPPPSPPPQPVTIPSPYHPKPNLIRRNLAPSTARRSEAESESDLEKENENMRPARTYKRAPSTNKLKLLNIARHKAKPSPLESDSNSDLPAPPPHRATGTTLRTVKSGMKPKLTPKRSADQDERGNHEEICTCPTKSKRAERGKEKEKS